LQLYSSNKLKKHDLTNVQTNCGTRRVPKVGGSKQVVEPYWVRSFEKYGETWLCMSEAFSTYGYGTRILHLAEEYGLTKQVRGTTTYYRERELPGFRKWINTNYPNMLFLADI